MTEDYVSLYLNLPFSQNDPTAFLSLLFLFFWQNAPHHCASAIFWSKNSPALR